MPNSLGRVDQEKINQELMQYDKLIGVKCYPLLPLFLCSIYAPKCIPSTGGFLIPPCRSLCRGESHISSRERANERTSARASLSVLATDPLSHTHHTNTSCRQEVRLLPEGLHSELACQLLHEL